MNKNNIFLALAGTMLLASCSSTLDTPDAPNQPIPGKKVVTYSPAKAAEVNLFSNGVRLGSITRAEDNPYVAPTAADKFTMPELTIPEEQQAWFTADYGISEEGQNHIWDNSSNGNKPSGSLIVNSDLYSNLESGCTLYVVGKDIVLQPEIARNSTIIVMPGSSAILKGLGNAENKCVINAYGNLEIACQPQNAKINIAGDYNTPDSDLSLGSPFELNVAGDLHVKNLNLDNTVLKANSITADNINVINTSSDVDVVEGIDCDNFTIGAGALNSKYLIATDKVSMTGQTIVEVLETIKAEGKDNNGYAMTLSTTTNHVHTKCLMAPNGTISIPNNNPVHAKYVKAQNLRMDAGAQLYIDAKGVIDVEKDINIPNKNGTIHFPGNADSMGIIQAASLTAQIQPNNNVQPVVDGIEGTPLFKGYVYLAFGEFTGTDNIWGLDATVGVAGNTNAVRPEIDLAGTCLADVTELPEPWYNPVIDPKNNHVEVNLAINDPHEKGDWVESHLSIHVRAASDVEVFLPVPVQYYCPADDMMIVSKHDVDYIYEKSEKSVSTQIAGQTVTLTTTYAEEGIYVKVAGVNQIVLDYLGTTYGDGLTFEVRNYYSKEAIKEIEGNEGDWTETVPSITRTDLRDLLNQSTVTFSVGDPTYYVNAFGYVEQYDPETGKKLPDSTREINKWSCKVTPTDAAYKALSGKELEENPLKKDWNVVYKK